jgi:hypothetical protein
MTATAILTAMTISVASEQANAGANLPAARKEAFRCEVKNDGDIAGVMLVILILALGLLFALMAFTGMRGANTPSKPARTLGGHARDASIGRAAPKLANAITANEANLTAGARLYHGTTAFVGQSHFGGI